jgi:AAA domain
LRKSKYAATNLNEPLNLSRIHPELEEFRRLIKEKRQPISLLKKNMLRSISIAIESLDTNLPKGSDVYMRSSLISSGTEAELTSPLEIIKTLSGSVDSLKLLEDEPTFTEGDFNRTIISHSSILGHLLPVTVGAAKNDNKWPISSLPWNRRRRELCAGLSSIRMCLEGVRKSDMFSLDKAEAYCLDLRQTEEGHNRALSRIKTEILDDARVMVATIGSSHKIPVLGQGTDGSTSLESKLGQLQIKGNSGRETIVVFDEAGCIPAYELLGLSRLNRTIKALICVGDKHQLPPYSPGSMDQKRKSFRRQPSVMREEKVDSLLDVSALEDDGDRGGKITLNTQYRDIANVLNERIYKGNYCTPISCSVPTRGFHFVHVEYFHGGKKYENEDEVKKCVELVTRYKSSGESMMVLTPVSAMSFSLCGEATIKPTMADTHHFFVPQYKKQQRRLQYTLKHNGVDEGQVPVLTIDQCQGREADLVFLSLTRRPTRFLNKNRFNVALSRVRQKLFLLCDQKDFQAAAKDSSWECNLLAKDLLQLAAGSGGYGDSDGYDSDDYLDAYYK